MFIHECSNARRGDGTEAGTGLEPFANGSNVAALSRRERMIAAKFAEGRTYKEIAQLLCISPGTVRTHLSTIYRKLGVSNKVMLVELMAPHAQTIDLRRPWPAHEVPARHCSRQAVQVSPQDKGYLAEDGAQLALSSTCAGCMPVEDWRSGAAQGRRMSQTLLEIEHLIPSAKLPIGIGSSFDSDELGGLLRALDALLVRFGSVLTQRREALDRLAASEAGYRALVSTQDGLVARITPDGRLSFVNDAYCCYYGRRRDEILGHTYNEFTLTISEDRERDTMHLSSLTPEHPSAIIELRRQLPNGGMRYVQWTDTALFDAGGQLVEVQSVGRDVTDRMAAEPRFWCVGA